MTSLRVFGYASIVVGVLLPVGLALLPRLIWSIQEKSYPRRYHYYYVANEQSSSWIPIVAISAILLLVGTLLIILDRRKATD